MMNLLALGLVLTSLVTAGFFTSSPEKQDVIVKEGHRVVVVEYEKDAERTKVLISPHDTLASQIDGDKRVVTNGEEKLFEKMEDVNEKAKEVSSSVLHDAGEKTHHMFSPKEMVCDAYGKCKETLAGVIGKTKDKASEVKEETQERVSDTAHTASDKLHEAKESLKDSASDFSEKITEKLREVKEGVKEELSRKAKEVEQRAESASERAKETVSEATHKASDKVQEARESVQDSASEVSQEVTDKVSHKAREVKEGAKEQLSKKAKEAEERAKTIKKEGKKEFGEILRRASEVVTDVYKYTVPRDERKLFASMLNLMGFSAAYGMCLWITFASSYVLARALPRPLFSMVQSKIYPVYFKAMAYSVGLALLGHLMNPRKALGKLQATNLMASLGMIMVNLLHFEPLATKAMLERMKKEKEDSSAQQDQDRDSIAETAGRGPLGGAKRGTYEKPEEAAAKSEIIKLGNDLRRLNSNSSTLNVLTLVSLTWYLVHLGHQC